MNAIQTCVKPPASPEVIIISAFLVIGVVALCGMRYGHHPQAFSRAMCWTYISTAALYGALAMAKYLHEDGEVQKIQDDQRRIKARVSNGTHLLIRIGFVALLALFPALGLHNLINTAKYIKYNGALLTAIGSLFLTACIDECR